MTARGVVWVGAALLLGIAGAGCWRSDVATASEEAAFAAVQARGEEVMGVDQYTSTHRFDALPDGGRIELQRDVDDAEGVARIREHFQTIARAFAAGEFDMPVLVHGREVPGAEVLAAKKDRIEYIYGELPRGAELRLVTNDREAIAAIHEFMTFQREDHRAGGIGAHGSGEHHGRDHHQPAMPMHDENHDAAHRGLQHRPAARDGSDSPR